MSATTNQLLSSGEFYKVCYDTKPVKSASANIFFYTNNSKMPNFELWHSCRKWAMCGHKVKFCAHYLSKHCLVTLNILSTDWFLLDRNRLFVKYKHNRKIILIQISNKLAVIRWTVSDWLRMGCSDRLLWLH